MNSLVNERTQTFVYKIDPLRKIISIIESFNPLIFASLSKTSLEYFLPPFNFFVSCLTDWLLLNPKELIVVIGVAVVVGVVVVVVVVAVVGVVLVSVSRHLADLIASNKFLLGLMRNKSFDVKMTKLEFFVLIVCFAMKLACFVIRVPKKAKSSS